MWKDLQPLGGSVEKDERMLCVNIQRYASSRQISQPTGDIDSQNYLICSGTFIRTRTTSAFPHPCIHSMMHNASPGWVLNKCYWLNK